MFLITEILNLLNLSSLIMPIMMQPFQEGAGLSKVPSILWPEKYLNLLKMPAAGGRVIARITAIISSGVTFEATNLGKVVAPPAFFLLSNF